MFDVILRILAVLSPTLFAVAIQLARRKTKKARVWRVGLIAFGIAMSGITALQIYRSDIAHEKEIREQLANSDSLRAELLQSELNQRESSSYFRAKLEDQGHFCGVTSELAAGVKVLAATGADYERRLYEAKVVSNDELYELTMKAVTRIRDFSEERQRISNQEMEEERNVALANDLSDADKRQRQDQIWGKYREVNRSREKGFHSILADVLYVTGELQKRKLAEPTLTPATRADVNRVLSGIVAGAYPEVHLADYLEVWVKPLEPRQEKLQTARLSTGNRVRMNAELR
jgi:hypothetical protein